ncbi:response regulator transcription factor [Ectobacillus funiculus]|uniref:response regulator transcription factor n=1 Tax=Ectobacillus funiculus TaxID=137993 RepID=UPI00101DB9E4|nr:helix-turn-helix domain-containing protein [Ectobacillus funiculus]
MYKVMLVDDDYPVLEFLSEAIEWEQLGVTLQSTHENGMSAFERAMLEMPDILITDIGMPKMNGIELTKQLKDRNPNLQVAILSCHSEFGFAQQALKLQVQEYLVKDTFDPEELCNVIKKLKKNLDDAQNKTLKQLHLQSMLDRNRESVKERFIKKTINSAKMDEKEWLTEAKLLGLQLDQTRYIASRAMIHDFSLVKEKYFSEDTLDFAINNVVTEAIEAHCPSAVHFNLGARELFVFFPSSSTLKFQAVSAATEGMKRIQHALKKSLNISLSFLIGEQCTNLITFKQELTLLLNSEHQSFYMESGTIVEKKAAEATNEDLFSRYDEAAAEMRELVMLRDEGRITTFVAKWSAFLEEKQFPPEIVKDWVLKLVLDLRVRLQALQFFRSDYTVECLHNEILTIRFFSELKVWLMDYFKSVLSRVHEVYEQTRRREILDAFRYVSINLEKKISLEEVASYLFLNPSYFSRLFKKEVGETFVEYVTKMKVSRAKELLEQTADSVGKICERLGYDNQSYFIKIFKNYVGVTPIEYRGGKA